MEKLEGGVWAIFMKGLCEGQKYKYCVDGADGRQVLKADPFAAFSEWGEQTASIIWNGGSFHWRDKNYLDRRAKTDFMRAP